MIIYIDENMPQMLAAGLNILQQPENMKLKPAQRIVVKSIKEEFGAGALDENWIPVAGGRRSLGLLTRRNVPLLLRSPKSLLD